MKPKFLLGGALVLMAVAVIIAQGLAAGAQYFFTISQLREKAAEFQDQSVRISGAVIGDSIAYDAASGRLEFDIVDAVEMNGRFEPIAGQTPLRIVYDDPRPELLQDQAQAIVTGKLSADGTFHADELLLKCPTRYEEEFPNQAQGN
ncbi:MAG TPA: cytochrome c maturation protein CcmE [Anaerolineae bacterium]